MNLKERLKIYKISGHKKIKHRKNTLLGKLLRGNRKLNYGIK